MKITIKKKNCCLNQKKKNTTQIKRSKTSHSFLQTLGKPFLHNLLFFSKAKRYPLIPVLFPHFTLEDTLPVMKVIFMLSLLFGLNIEHNFVVSVIFISDPERRCACICSKLESKPPIHLKLAIHWDLRTMIFLWVPSLHQMWCWFPS